MILRFHIRPSGILCRCIIGLYALAVISLSQFQIAPVYKWGLVIWVCISAVCFIRKWRKSGVRCEYNVQKDNWQVFNAEGEGMRVTNVFPVYVTGHFGWINFYTNPSVTVPVFVGPDSMQAANYLQLRRSVICPAVLRSCSA